MPPLGPAVGHTDKHVDLLFSAGAAKLVNMPSDNTGTENKNQLVAKLTSAMRATEKLRREVDELDTLASSFYRRRSAQLSDVRRDTGRFSPVTSEATAKDDVVEDID